MVLSGLIHKSAFNLKIIWAGRSKCLHYTVQQLMLLSAGAPWFCSMWQNSNRLEQVSLQDSLRVEFQWSKDSHFKIFSGPMLQKAQNLSSPTFCWSTQVTRPHRFMVQSKTSLLDEGCEILSSSIQSTIPHTTSLHGLLSCFLFGSLALLRYN